MQLWMFVCVCVCLSVCFRASIERVNDVVFFCFKFYFIFIFLTFKSVFLVCLYTFYSIIKCCEHILWMLKVWFFLARFLNRNYITVCPWMFGNWSKFRSGSCRLFCDAILQSILLLGLSVCPLSACLSSVCLFLYVSVCLSLPPLPPSPLH